MSEAISYGSGDSSYRAAGGYDGLRQLVDRFYDIMQSLPEASAVRAMHSQDLSTSRDKLTRFLCGWLGGPRLYREKYGPIIIPEAHRHLRIGRTERDAWLKCMELALQQQDYEPEFKRYLLQQLARPAEFCRNRE